MKLITIHTDGDFPIYYKDEKIKAYEEKIYLIFSSTEEFYVAIWNGELHSDEVGQNILLDMAEYGEGKFGNYSLTIEEFNPWVYDVESETYLNTINTNGNKTEIETTKLVKDIEKKGINNESK